GPTPPALSFVLAPASDTGVKGDDLTAANPASLLVTTDANQQVVLDKDGNGFNDGTVTADASGHATFTNVSLAAGVNNVRVQAANAAGPTTAQRAITLDAVPPT